MSYLLSGALIGLVGDAALQLYVPEFGNSRARMAFTNYFESWGSGPSLIAAMGLTGGVSWAMGKIASNPVEFMALSVFVDDIYREYHSFIYPTLGPYYQAYSRDSTRIYNVIVAGIVWGVNKFIV
jgi:hypothetical protein